MAPKRNVKDQDFESSDGEDPTAALDPAGSGDESLSDDAYEDSSEEEEVKVKKTTPKASKPAETSKPAAAKPKAKEEKAAAPAKKSDTKKSSDADPATVIADYLSSTNRPYNAQNIFDNLHGSFKKPQIEKTLKALLESGKISSKDIGKSSIYWAPQGGLAVCSAEEMAAMNAEIVALQEEFQKTDFKAKELQNLQSSLNVAFDNAALADEIARLEKENQAFSKRLDNIDTESASFDPEAKKKIDALFLFAQQEYRKRRRLCKESIQTVCDMVGEKADALIEDWGIETDEAANFIAPSRPSLSEAPPPAKRSRK
eukprot:ANDGO_06086.mRNA.1 Homologous-pairing protein 2 homolog